MGVFGKVHAAHLKKRGVGPARARNKIMAAAKRNANTAKAKPRKLIKASPKSAPNVHVFKRSYSHPFTIGVADATNGVLLNTDNKYMVVKLHTKFNKLPKYTEFKSLFSEYKITSVTHRLIPYYSNNLTASALDTTTYYQNAIPNYEIIILPVNSSARDNALHTLNSTELDDYVNQAQQKSIRLMPSGRQVFTCKNLKVVGYAGPLSKDAGTALMVMQSPSYLNTDPTALVTGGVDQTDVTHYSVTFLIRRVDGDAFPSELSTSRVASMGFRMENEVFFQTRKVQ